jgi:hypothetical protein
LISIEIQGRVRHLKVIIHAAGYYVSVIPTLGERAQRQKDLMFKTSMGYTMRSCHKTKQQSSYYNCKAVRG